MPPVLLDDRRRLRNGWWMLLFVALFIASRPLYAPLKHALQSLGATEAWLEPVRFLLVLGITWICLRLRRERLADVGLGIDRRWCAQAGAGLAIGIASVLFAAGLMWLLGGVRFALDPERSIETLFLGLYLFACVSLFEELLFRGFLFQRLVDGAGAWIAQLAFALLFAASHWGNPEMDGATMAWASVELFLGALLLGLAFLRTRSLALPVGLHLGWNWAQGHLLGYGVSGFEHGGWFRAELQPMPGWITGGGFGLEASVCAVASDLLLIALLWRWRGSPAREISPPPAASEQPVAAASAA